MRSVLRRLLATAAVAGVAVTLQMTGPGASSSSTSIMAVPLAAFPVPVHDGRGLSVRDEVPKPRPQLTGFHRSLVRLGRGDQEQPGAEP